MENFGYLFAAYSVIFAALILYMLFIWRRQGRLADDLSSVEKRLESLEGEPMQAAGVRDEK